MESLDTLLRNFPITARAVYLDHAAIGPISRGVQDAVRRQTEIHVTSVDRNRTLHAPIYDRCRDDTARSIFPTTRAVSSRARKTPPA